MYLIMQGYEKRKWSVVLHSDFTTETFWFDHPKKAFEFAKSKAPQCKGNGNKLPWYEHNNCIICYGKNKWYLHMQTETHKCSSAKEAYLEAVMLTGFYSEWEDDIY